VLPAKLVGADPLTDLAVIKVNATNLPSVPWGNSAGPPAGTQTVLAFGIRTGTASRDARHRQRAEPSNPDASDRRKPGEFIQTTLHQSREFRRRAG